MAPRNKTATPQLLEIPEPLRPILQAWWERHEEPKEGLVFPSSRGKRAGESKRKVSHARALKRDLRRALGAATWSPEKGRWEDKPPSKYTRRERELFTETSYSKPIDFHSFRRSFNTALADAGVNIQVAMRLAGHTSTAAHMRYVMSRVRTMPAAALPKLKMGSRRRDVGQGRCPNEKSTLAGASLSSGISAGWTGLETERRHRSWRNHRGRRGSPPLVPPGQPRVLTWCDRLRVRFDRAC